MHQPQAIFGGSKRSNKKAALPQHVRARDSHPITAAAQPSLPCIPGHPASALPRCTLCWHFAKRLLTFRARPVCSPCAASLASRGRSRGLRGSCRLQVGRPRCGVALLGARVQVCGRDVRDVSRRAIAARRRVSRRSVMPSVHGLQRGHSERCMHAAHVSDDVQWP